MKKYWKWIVIAIVVALAAWGGTRVMAKRQAAAALANAPKAETIIELAPNDIATAQVLTLSQGLPISGTLKAVQSAVVKARVVGELRGLTVREGEFVKAGQVLARIDSPEYATRVAGAQQSAQAAKAQVDIAQRTYDNNKALVNQGFISATALDTSAASLAAAKSNHAAALSNVDLARKSVSDMAVTAPISGTVAQRMAQNGERVSPEARIVEIVDLSRIELEAQLSAADSMDVRVGQQASLQLEGRSDSVAATITRINPSAVAGSRSVLVYLSLAASPGLRQGLFAQGTLATAQVQTLSVPLSAVRNDKPAPYVQLMENGVIRHQPVEVGARGESQGISMVAIKNIAASASVTLASAGSLREGTKVSTTRTTAAPASMPAAPGASAAP
jgi:membrane fusion protein, multidrug efflux system